MPERIPSALETAQQHGSGPEIPNSLKNEVINEQLKKARERAAKRAANSGLSGFFTSAGSTFNTDLDKP